MHPFRDTGLVLRTFDLGEADRIITILTRRHGLVRAVARAVRRTRSRFGASLEPFAFVDVLIAPGRRGPNGSSGLGTIRQVTSVESFAGRITSDYPSYTAGCMVLETTERIAGDEGVPAGRVLGLAVGACRSLAERRRDPGLLVDAYALRAMTAAGWEPVLEACVRCGAVGPHRWYHVPSSGSVCTACRPQGAMRLSPGVAGHLTALLAGRWDSAAPASSEVARQGSELAAAHLQWHLERELRTLSHVDRGDTHARTV